MDAVLVAPMFLAGLGCLILGGLNLYQAVTGNRLSKRPSVRSDAVMRRESAIAGAVLVSCSALIGVMLWLLAT